MNQKLVDGQRIMNLAGQDKSVDSFISSFKEQYGLNEQAAKQEKIKVGRWADQIGLPQNILKVETGDRDAVLDWNQGMRDKFVEAMKKYDESGDDKDRRVADEILVKVKNLDQQLGLFQADKQKYLEDYEAGNLLPGQFDAGFYAEHYTKNKESAFTVNEDGNILFSDGTLFNDKKQGYKLKFDGGKTLMDDSVIKAIKLASTDVQSQSGNKNFDFKTTQMAFDEGFKNPKIGGGAQAVMVLSQTDLNDFDEKNITFANEYVNGLLPDEIYEMLEGSGISDNTGSQSATQGGNNLKRDAKWMEDPANTDVLRKMISTYVARGVETVYNEKFDEEFGVQSEKGFLSFPQGKVKSELLRTVFSAGATKGLYDMIKLGKKDNITIAGTKIISNGDGTYTTAGIGNVVTQAMVNDGSYKKEQLGNQITSRYANSQELIEKLGIYDKDFEKLVQIEEENPPEGDDEQKKKKKSKLPTKPKGIDRNYFIGPMTSERVLEVEKLYPGLKMVKTNPNSINSTKYTLTFNGKNPQEIDTKRVENRLFDGPSKSKNEFDNYINKYIK